MTAPRCATARLVTLALLSALVALSACGRRGDPVRPLPTPVPTIVEEPAAAPPSTAPALPTPPIPPGPTIEESTTPEGEEVF